MINLSNLRKRILFVSWAVPLGWFVINSNISLIPKNIFTLYPVHLLIIFLIIGSCFEYCKMLSIFYRPNGFWLSYLWLALQFFLLFQSDSTIPSTISIYTLLLIVALEAMIWGKQRSRWVRASLLFSGNAFLYIASASMISLYRQPFQSLFIHFNHPMLSQVGIVIVIGAIFM
ncbi:MAG: hypothetical protein N2053_00755, partial [Chitinispirillaceae bacterium]|nr:hypothetical protein [Chitinispirillaceae bacterium]